MTATVIPLHWVGSVALILGCWLTYWGQAKAWFNRALCPRKPEGSLGQTAQDGHLDFRIAPELCL